jgi:hypothetical protein
MPGRDRPRGIPGRREREAAVRIGSFRGSSSATTRPLFRNIFAPLALFAVATLTAKRARNAKRAEGQGGYPSRRPTDPGRIRPDGASRLGLRPVSRVALVEMRVRHGKERRRHEARGGNRCPAPSSLPRPQRSTRLNRRGAAVPNVRSRRHCLPGARARDPSPAATPARNPRSCRSPGRVAARCRG